MIQFEWEDAATRWNALCEASTELGSWMSAALDDPGVCDEMKSDIRRWFEALGRVGWLPDEEKEMSKHHHVSLDLETGGTGTNAALRAIGAVKFDIRTGEILSRFYVNVDIEDHVRRGGIADERTLEWWSQQSVESQLALLVDPKSVETALAAFTNWMPNGAPLWGNGSNFDNRVLREAYSLLGMYCPWHWIADRDIRTLVVTNQTLGLKRPDIPRVGTHHNAVDDAEFQANLVFALIQSIRGAMLP